MNPKNIGTHLTRIITDSSFVNVYMKDEDAKIVCQFYKVQLKDARGVLTNVK